MSVAEATRHSLRHLLVFNSSELGSIYTSTFSSSHLRGYKAQRRLCLSYVVLESSRKTLESHPHVCIQLWFSRCGKAVKLLLLVLLLHSCGSVVIQGIKVGTSPKRSRK